MNRTRISSRRQGERGAALLIAMVLVAVLAVIALGLVNRATNEMQAVSAKRHYDSAVSCADGAQALIRSQLQTYGKTATTMSTVINDATYTTGHYSNPLTITAVGPYVQGTPKAGGSGTSTGGDMANRVGGGSTNGTTTFQATVVCSNTLNPGHQIEVDVLFSFGL
jgi:type II secretory pathway pseudopilin PulG